MATVPRRHPGHTKSISFLVLAFLRPSSVLAKQGDLIGPIFAHWVIFPLSSFFVN
jgi:hypothetical protein